MAFPLQEQYVNLLTDTEIANFSPAEQDTYENSLKYYRDMNNVIDTSRQDGVKEGRRAEKIEIARSRLGNLPVNTISQTTGLTAVEIAKLQSDNKPG